MLFYFELLSYFIRILFLFYLHFAPSPPLTRHYPILFAPFFLFISHLFYSNSSPYSSPSPIFSTFIPAPFPFQTTSIFSPLFPFSFSTKDLFLHHLNPFALKAWRLYRTIAMTLPHKSSAISIVKSIDIRAQKLFFCTATALPSTNKGIKIRFEYTKNGERKAKESTRNALNFYAIFDRQ